MKRVLVLAFLAAGCVGDLERECSLDGDCLQDGLPGQCLPTTGTSGKKWCVFAASSCVSGKKWGLLSGDGLADTCVTASGPGAADGGVAGPDAGTALAVDPPSHDFGAVASGRRRRRS